MKEKFIKLIDVKTIVTFAIVGTVIALGVDGRIEADKIYTLGLMVLSFYFGTQAIKNTGV